MASSQKLVLRAALHVGRYERSRIWSRTTSFYRPASFFVGPSFPGAQFSRQNVGDCRYFCAAAAPSLNALIKDLRALSGAPIVECKKALEQSNNDVSAAMDWLREHGAAKASSKLAGRETTEGLVGLKLNSNNESGTAAALVKVASETDFAGRSEKFVDLVLKVADATLHCTESEGVLDGDLILQATPFEGGKTVKDLLDEAIVAIRENLSIPNAIRLTSSTSGKDGTILVGYVHNKIGSANAGSAASVVEISPLENGPSNENALKAIGKKLAMHVVAARPLYLSPKDVPSDILEKETSFFTKELGDSGKPPAIVEKIVQGKMRKFYEGICLTEQAHMIEEGNPKISKFLKEQGVDLKAFHHLSIA